MSDEGYSRKQLCEIAGVADNVLGFWLKAGLIVPTAGGGGRGNHRRFNRAQVNIAAILKEVHAFGTNIGFLKSIGGTMQKAASLNQRFPRHRQYLRLAGNAARGWYLDGWEKHNEPADVLAIKSLAARLGDDEHIAASIADDIAGKFFTHDYEEDWTWLVWIDREGVTKIESQPGLDGLMGLMTEIGTKGMVLGVERILRDAWADHGGLED